MSQSTAATTPTPLDPATASIDAYLGLIHEALDDVKAKNITVLDVAELTDMTDRIVVADATSKRHVKALADHLSAQAKQAGLQPLGREGEKDSEWTLVDLGAVVVHIMMPEARKFYDLEGLWSSPEQLSALTQPVAEKRLRR